MFAIIQVRDYRVRMGGRYWREYERVRFYFANGLDVGFKMWEPSQAFSEALVEVLTYRLLSKFGS